MKMATTAIANPAFKPRVRPLGNHRYLIESKTTRGVGHQVDAIRNTCGCPAGKRGMPRCWHRTLAATLDAQLTVWYEQHQTQARAAACPAGMAALQECFAA